MIQRLVGKQAPNFRMETAAGNGEDFRQVSLSDYKGKWLIFFFYPLDFTFVCPTEITALSDASELFKDLDTEILGVSTDIKLLIEHGSIHRVIKILGGTIMDISVVVYTSTGCPHCHKVKEQLNEWGIAYEERNVSETKEYFEELQERKIFGTPATLINRKIVLGFQADKMKKLLGIEVQSREKKSSDTAAESGSPVFNKVDGNILDQTYDFVAIGGGPAGASAAVYAARGKLKTLVIDKAPAAGTLAITHKIANYPGVRKEQTGLELLAEMQLQAQDFGAVFVQTHVLDVDFSDPDIKILKIPEGIIKAKSVFIAVGAKAPAGKIKGEEEFTGRGVSYCSTCDAAFFEGKTVVVAGDNVEALHEADGYVSVDENLKTSMDGVYAGGDARKTPIKQAVISAADGCIAALGADQFVNQRSKMRPQYS